VGGTGGGDETRRRPEGGVLHEVVRPGMLFRNTTKTKTKVNLVVLLTPHIAGVSRQASATLFKVALENAMRVLGGEAALHRVY
jgi:phosphoglycerate dehydrogenase-like enzyme